MVLISEVSELALEIVEQSFENEDKMTVDIEVPANRKVKFLGDISWSSDPRLGRHARSKSTMESDDESEATEREAKDERGCMQPGEDMRSSSMNLPFKDLLDYCKYPSSGSSILAQQLTGYIVSSSIGEEPVNKMDRVSYKMRGCVLSLYVVDLTLMIIAVDECVHTGYSQVSSCFDFYGRKVSIWKCFRSSFKPRRGSGLGIQCISTNCIVI